MRILKALLLAAILAGCLASLASAAASKAITGEIIDTFCFATMGARGESHRQCAMDCAKAGIPLGILEDQTNQVYVLLPPKNKEPVPQALIDQCARKVTITGQVYKVGGSQFLTVESFK